MNEGEENGMDGRDRYHFIGAHSPLLFLLHYSLSLSLFPALSPYLTAEIACRLERRLFFSPPSPPYPVAGTGGKKPCCTHIEEQENSCVRGELCLSLFEILSGRSHGKRDHKECGER